MCQVEDLLPNLTSKYALYVNLHMHHFLKLAMHLPNVLSGVVAIFYPIPVTLVGLASLHSNDNFFAKFDIDSAIWTHLPFLLPILQKEFPNKFFDPAKDIARTVKKRLAPSPRNRLSVYTSSDVKIMQKKLELLQIKRRVSFLA